MFYVTDHNPNPKTGTQGSARFDANRHVEIRAQPPFSAMVKISWRVHGVERVFHLGERADFRAKPSGGATGLP